MSNRDGRDGPVPWASVFDPAANARALGEIQSRGLRAAGDLVDRLIEAVDGRRHLDTWVPGADTATEGTSAGGPADGIFELWADLVRTGLDALSQLTSGVLVDGDDVGPIDLRSSGPSAPLRLHGAGPEMTSEVWLHNGAMEPMDAVELRAGDLLGADGRVLPASAISFDPPGPLEVGARTSRGLTIRVEPPSDQAPGHYRGTVQAVGVQDLWLPIEVIIE